MPAAAKDRYTLLAPLDLTNVARVLDTAPALPVSLDVEFRAGRMGASPRLLAETLARDPRVRAVTFVSASSPSRRGWDWPLDVAVHGPEPEPEWVANASYEYLRRVRGFRASTLVELALLPVGLDEAARLDVPAPLAPVHTLVVMGEASGEDELERLDALRSRWRADAAVAPSLPPAAWSQWLGAVTRELAHDLPLDAALFVASAAVNGPRPLCIGKPRAFENAHLSAHAKRALPKMKSVPDASVLLDEITHEVPGTFTHEDRGARRMKNIEEASAAARAAAPPPPREPRHVFADLHRDGQPVERGEAGVLHQLDVQLRVRGPGVMASEALAEPPDWVEGETHQLDVLFQELKAGAQSHRRTITLPPVGPSTVASFDLTLPDQPELRARITVLERPARILQVLEYRLPIGAAPTPGLDRPTLTPEVEIRDADALGGARTPIAASAVVGGRDGIDLLQLIRRGEGIQVPLGSFQLLVQNVSAALDAFADGQKTSSKLSEGENLELLRSLADEGVQLRRALAAQWGPALESAPHIQLVSGDVNSLLPLEVCYDGPAPSSSAKLCTEAVPRLVAGHRDCTCDPSSVDLVCPLRFWALSRVIERHGPHPPWNAQLLGTTAAIAGSVGERKRIDLGGRVLWAMDAIVDSSGSGDTRKERQRHAKALKQALQADFVKVDTWEEWERSVKEPTRIIAAVVHNDDETAGAKGLYLNDERRSLGKIDERLVGKGPALPIVLLLGCKTLGPSATSFQPAFSFKVAQVPAVVATQSLVIGRFAADCAHELVMMLRAQSEATPAMSLGALLRRARAILLAKGLTTALAIVALGDADLLVGKEA